MAQQREASVSAVPMSALTTTIGRQLVKSAVTRSTLLERRVGFLTNGNSAVNSSLIRQSDYLLAPSTPTHTDINPPPPLSTSNVPPSNKIPTVSATASWKVPTFVNNPMMDNFALALDSMTMSLLPPGMEDLKVVVVDSKNGIVTFDKMDLRVAVIDGRMLLYPRNVSSNKVDCPFKNSTEVLVFRPIDGKWLRGCSANFEVLKSQMMAAPQSLHWVASTAQIHQEMQIPTSQALTIGDVLTFVCKR
nr:MAG: wsv134-like protein [Penaeus semisulcatus pemonivirus]